MRLATRMGLATRTGLAIVIAIHTFGEYLDFHLHSNALVADGLFDRQSKFYVMRVGKDGGDTRTKISPLE